MFGGGLFDVPAGFMVECESNFRNSFHCREPVPLLTDDPAPLVEEIEGLEAAAVSVTYEGGFDDDDATGDSFLGSEPMSTEVQDASADGNIVIDCDIDINNKEQEKKYVILSKDSSVLLDGNHRYDSIETWEILRDLALPKPMRYLCLYIRHTLMACERWLAVLFEKMKTSSVPTDILPVTFETDFVPCMEKILEKVQQKGWVCSISKKYNDALSDFCLLPRCRYDVVHEKGFLHTTLMDRKMGNAFRKISREINVGSQVSSTHGSRRGAGDKSGNPLNMVPNLWCLELKLTCLMNILTEWSNQSHLNIYHFPQLFDSRTLYSDSTQHIESGKPILTYDVNQLRVATSMLYWRWNDLNPSEDLWEYLSLLKARCAILSSCVLSSVIQRTLNDTPTTAHGCSPIDDSISPIIDPSIAYSKYLGNNTRDAIASLCGSRVMKNSFSQTIFDLTHKGDRRGVGGSSKANVGGKRSLEADKKRMRNWITRKQRINTKIRKQIEMERFPFDSIAEKEDSRGSSSQTPRGSEQRQKQKDVLEYGNRVPRMVKQTLNKGMVMASESSSSDGDGDFLRDDGSDEFSDTADGGDPTDHHINQQKDDRTGGTSIPEDLDYFSKYLKEGKRVYKNIGKAYSEADVCNEMLTNYLLSCSDFFHGRIRDAFLPCVTTTCSIVKEPTSDFGNTTDSTCSIRATTYTNKLFLTETHCLLSRIEQDVKAWDSLKQMERYYHEYPRRFKESGRKSLQWRNVSDEDRAIADEYKRQNLSEYLSLEKAKAGDAKIRKELIEVEAAKIQCLLQWCYDYSSGQRNQFIYRNLRDPMYSMYLMPSEADMLLNICSIRNCNLNPSVIVSKIRHTDVDRLEKILRDTTTYGIMKEFARCNALHISESSEATSATTGSTRKSKFGTGGDNVHTAANESLFRLSKYIYQISTSSSTNSSSTPPTLQEPQEAFEDMPYGSITYRFSSLRQLIDIQTEQDFNETAQRFQHTTEREREREGELLDMDPSESLHSCHGIAMRDIFQERQRMEMRKFLFSMHSEFRFLNDNFSVRWQCPRGISKVVRVTITKVLDYFMKGVSHHLGVNSFFFPDYVTIKLCNSHGFVQAMKFIQSKLDGTDEGECDDDELYNDETGASGFSPIPTRRELDDLFQREREDVSEHSEDDRSIIDHEETESFDVPADDPHTLLDYDLGTTVISGSFASFMHSNFEKSCKDFFMQCPIVLYTMCSSFLWNPRDFTAFECEGADSLIGLCTWLEAVMHHIQEEIIVHVLVHDAFTQLRKELTEHKIQDSYYESTEHDDVPENDTIWDSSDEPHVFPEEQRDEIDDDSIENEGGDGFSEDNEHPHFRNVMNDLYDKHHLYLNSTYADGGMYYEDFLKLLGKVSTFGDHGKYCTMTQNLCVCVVKLCRMIYPHILEDFHFHLEQVVTKSDEFYHFDTPSAVSETSDETTGTHGAGSSAGIRVFCPKTDQF